MTDALAIPLGTRLIHIERVVKVTPAKVTPAKWMTDEYVEISWRVWTALASDAIANPKKEGTFYELHDDGAAIRCVDDCGNFDIQTVMPPHVKQEEL